MRVVSSGEARRILDFDIENRPSSYWYDGNCTAEITAIAWGWYPDPSTIEVVALDPANGVEVEEVIRQFLVAYLEADLVTGHYIRKHDLPIINGACLELGLPALGTKKTQDTKLDLTKVGSISVSQESLGAMLGVESPKVQMSQSDWREANRLTPDGIEKTKERVVGDVKQHMEIRNKLLQRGLLKPPTNWFAVPGGVVYREV